MKYELELIKVKFKYKLSNILKINMLLARMF